MQAIQERARELAPQLTLTLLSIIQALALELLWSHIQEAPPAESGVQAALEWLQVFVLLIGILQVWFLYVSVAMRFRWVPSMGDAISPFAIGILEFALIELLGIGPQLPYWFMLMAAIFGVAAWASNSVFRRARLDPGNREFFENVSPSNWRDHLPAAFAVTSFAAFGLLLQWTEDRAWVAGAGLLFVGTVLALQMMQTRRFWNLAMYGPDPPRTTKREPANADDA